LVYYAIKLYQLIRGIKYFLLSTATVKGVIVRNQPVLFAGRGSISSLGKLHLGVIFSPFSLSGYAYIEARNKHAVIEFGNDVRLNNNAVIIADKTRISIGQNTIAGPCLQIFDSDFHNLNPQKRMDSDYECKPVFVGKNVFLGSNVTILKGVSIGDNTIIANGSIVTKSIPENVIAGGNPAKILKSL
jgi:maltose O-acetyltransferase